MPSFFISSAWLPCSKTSPSLMTMILSAFMIVESRCAMMTTLTEPDMAATMSSNAAWICFSFSESKALVASSRKSSWGLRRKARAMDSRCFWPPLRRLPLSPSMES
mmetsp:Transcript_101985/g.317249  ORF Transcript_101985/g.317249 Transcript_101985/m.317249 type:complete len:106 (+) Transcript_101985:123-440(+)